MEAIWTDFNDWLKLSEVLGAQQYEAVYEVVNCVPWKVNEMKEIHACSFRSG